MEKNGKGVEEGWKRKEEVRGRDDKERGREKNEGCEECQEFGRYRLGRRRKRMYVEKMVKDEGEGGKGARRVRDKG